MRKPYYAQYNQVYVWDLPLRFIHWTNAACILVLSVTGFIISRPISLQSSRAASFSYWFGDVRFIHFAFAYLFTVALAARIYWGFAGNRFARWSEFVPHSRRQFREIFQVICIDLLHICKLPVNSIGINSLAGFVYVVVHLLLIFQVITGFGLYASLSTAWFPHLFTWVNTLFGGESSVRYWHHLNMWILLIFTGWHIYLSWYHDYLEGRGTISSMIGGWKFIEKA